MSSSETEAQTLVSLAGSRDIPRVLRLVSELCKTLSSQLTDGKARLVHPSQVRLVSSATGDESVGELSAITLAGPDAAKDPSVDLAAAYVAPEVFAGKPEAVASTVYHVAAVAYHLLTGQPPFAGSSPAAIRIKVLLERPENPRSIRPELSAELAQVLLQSLDKKPASRPRSLDELTAQLMHAEQHAAQVVPSAAGVENIVGSVPGAPAQAAALAEGSPRPASPTQASKSKSAVAALLVAVMVMLASASLLLLRGGDKHEPLASAPALLQPGAPPPIRMDSGRIGKASEEAKSTVEVQPSHEREKSSSQIERKSKSDAQTRRTLRSAGETAAVQQGEAGPSPGAASDRFVKGSPTPKAGAPGAAVGPGAAPRPSPPFVGHKQVPAEAKRKKKVPAKTSPSRPSTGKQQSVRGAVPQIGKDNGHTKVTESSKQKSQRAEPSAESAQQASNQAPQFVPSSASGASGEVVTEETPQQPAPHTDKKKLFLGIVLLVIALGAALGACLLLWVIRRDRLLALQTAKTQRAGSEADTFLTTKAEETKSSKGEIDPFTVGQYTCYARLGEGGMGMVYKARHTELGREAAVKVLSPSAMVAPDAIELFQREAKLSSQINHPNSVFIYDHGNVSGALFYLVMEFIDGQSLDEIISPKGKAPRPLPIARVLTMTRQICSVLDTAHSQGIVHRDLKPHNVMVTKKEGQPDFVKVVDFGIARSLDAAPGRHTAAGAVIGTPAYMSPEQAAGDPTIDTRSDIFSLAVMVFHMLSGKIPFADKAKTPIEQLVQRATMTEPLGRGTLRAQGNITRELEAVLLRALDPDRNRRPQTAGEFYQELARAAA